MHAYLPGAKRVERSSSHWITAVAFYLRDKEKEPRVRNFVLFLILALRGVLGGKIGFNTKIPCGLAGCQVARGAVILYTVGAPEGQASEEGRKIKRFHELVTRVFDLFFTKGERVVCEIRKWR